MSKKLPNPSLDLDSVVFFDDFDKLIKRIRSAVLKRDGSFGAFEKLADVLNIDRATISNLPGVGTRYVRLWEELVKEYQTEFDEVQIDSRGEDNDQEITVGLDINFPTIQLSVTDLSVGERKCISKIQNLIGEYPSIRQILEFDADDFIGFGVGKKFRAVLSGLKIKIEAELNKRRDSSFTDNDFGSIFVERMGPNVELEELASFLVDVIERFIDKLEDEMCCSIFQGRWGFSEPKTTLEMLGKKYGVSRERIRQKENTLNDMLVKCIGASGEDIALALDGKIDNFLIEKMDKLSRCFWSERDFCDFIGFISGKQNVYEMVNPEVPPDFLDDFFVDRGAPCPYDEIRSYIAEGLLSSGSDLSADAIIYSLIKKERLRSDQGNLFPVNLKKDVAAACVLFNHPNGLPWSDVASLINASGYSKTAISTLRPDNSALRATDRVFLAGKGIYKHIRFMSLENINFESVFDAALACFIDNDRNVMHLGELQRSSDLLKSIDYYTIRYLFRNFGEVYGFFFDGKSQADSISLEKNVRPITQKEAIVQALIMRGKPMTKSEIAALLKSKSLAHASFYLDQLIDEEIVVQVDRMLYTVPQLAYDNVDVDRIVTEIECILQRECRPVDPSIFEFELNRALKQTYSKFFYASVARKFVASKGWYRKLNLYSVKNIPYKGLMDAIDIHCELSLDMANNIALLQANVAVSSDKARSTITQWQNKLKAGK